MGCESAIKKGENIVYRVLADTLGFTDNPREAIFVTPDGKFLRGGREYGGRLAARPFTHYELLSHPEIRNAVESVIRSCNIKLDYTEFDKLDVMIFLSKCIRVRPEIRELDVTVYRKPTSIQIAKLIEVANSLTGVISEHGELIEELFVDVIRFTGNGFELVTTIKGRITDAKYIFGRLRMYYRQT